MTARPCHVSTLGTERRTNVGTVANLSQVRP